MSVGAVHHIELWVPSLERAVASFGWALEALGYEEFQRWENGRSWRNGVTYLVAEESPVIVGGEHDRLRPGVNHLAFHAGSVDDVERIVEEAPRHGWRLMFADRHPHAGGPDHYAAFLENEDGFEIELVADWPRPAATPEFDREAHRQSAAVATSQHAQSDQEFIDAASLDDE